MPLPAADQIALTFDDGPDPDGTPLVLDALAAARLRATFFVVGERAAVSPDLVRRCVDEGHAVQLHCQRHVRHTELTRAAIEEDVDRACGVLAGLGIRPTAWRTPWGVRSPDTAGVAAARGLQLVGWTTDTEDWSGGGADQLLARVRDGLVGGAVVLAHDGLGPGARRRGCAETAAFVGPAAGVLRERELEAVVL